MKCFRRLKLLKAFAIVPKEQQEQDLHTIRLTAPPDDLLRLIDTIKYNILVLPHSNFLQLKAIS